jgi:DNA (cytosine-5)-methyltransferase 1
LELNRSKMTVIRADLRGFSGKPFAGVDLVSAGVPCPPFSIAGKQLGHNDERDLFPEALRVIRECEPKAVMLENVRGFASVKFASYREKLIAELRNLGYEAGGRLLQASKFGVSQLRPRYILVGLREDLAEYFRWPTAEPPPPTVGQKLFDLMGENGWPGVSSWAAAASDIAPTIVGGSKKHGGPDLGPTRAREQWKRLRVNGLSIGNSAPDENFPVDEMPRLTNRMVAKLQSFPDDWEFAGKKTAQYRQIGNAFPPLVAAAVASQIRLALKEIVPEDPEGAEDLFADRLVAGA